MTLKLVKQEDLGNNKILDSLNDEQKKAVQIINGPLLVIAGAGSGKTRVLTHRVAYLIHKNIKPQNILALTFTNKAAKEMIQRISNIVNFNESNRIWAGTFHSIFARILRFEAIKLGYTSSFSIYDVEDSLSIVKKIMNDSNLSQQKFSPQAIRHTISSAKNHMIDVEMFQMNSDNEFTKITGLVYEKYEDYLKNSNAMDFDDLLINMIRLFRKDSDILEKYQDKFKYILVDEYQDTNRVQYNIIKLLANKFRNICVVGDDAQSIYGWRGADIKNILDFQKDYPEANVIRLEQNYRSTKIILSAADSVIKFNKRQLSKKLWTENPNGDLIELIDSFDERDEARRIALNIKSLLHQDYSYQDIAVLYRTNAQSLVLENIFREENIPYIIIGGISFYQRKEIKDALAYLKILYNQQDNESFLRIVNEPHRGIGSVSLKKIIDYATINNLSVFQAFLQVDKIEGLQERAKIAVPKFVNFIKKYIDQKDNYPKSQLAYDYIKESGLLRYYEEIGTSDAEDRWNNLQQLLSDISSYFTREPDGNLDDYLQQITLLTDFDQKDLSNDKVKLMTLHSAKGLEFPVVFITGLEQGLFPLMRLENTNEDEEEERRLFYVGITRAKEKLFLSYANRRMKFGNNKIQIPSMFLTEIDSKYLSKSITKKEKFNDYENTDFNSSYNNKQYQNTKPNKSNTEIKFSASALSKNNFYFDFHMGDLVNHSKFGIGKVLIITGEGDNTKAVVDFKDIGKKVLLLKYAKLDKVK